jgi:hypothetical protein
MARFLNRHGLDMDEDDGLSFLINAICGGLEDSVRFLVAETGVPPGPCPVLGCLVEMALKSSHYRVARLLVSLGAEWEETRQKLKKSSAENPLSLILPAEQNEFGCTCGTGPQYRWAGPAHSQTLEEEPLEWFMRQ